MARRRRTGATTGAHFARSGSGSWSRAGPTRRPNDVPLLPERILADVRRAAPDAVLVTDVGWNKNGVGQQYPVDSPDSFLTPGGFSTMGFGPAAVIGVAAAATGRPALALVGDGAFGSNPSVVATAVEMGIAPIWLVMNNAAFGTIAGLQRKHYGTGYGCEFEADGQAYSPDFAAIARACGGRRHLRRERR